MEGIVSLNLGFMMPSMQQLDGHWMEICILSFVFKRFGNQWRVKDYMCLLIPSICIFQKSLEPDFKVCLEDGFGDIDHDFARDGLTHCKLISHWLTGSDN